MALKTRVNRLERAHAGTNARCEACGALIDPPRPIEMRLAWSDDPLEDEPCAICGRPRMLVLTFDERD